MSDLRNTSLGRYLIRSSRESLGAEGITYSDNQWRRMVRNNTNNGCRRPSPKMADSQSISKSLTQIYKEIGMNKVTKQTYYKIENLEPDVLRILTAIILNSSRDSLNNYLESIGGQPDIVSEEEWDALKRFGKDLHQNR